MRSPFAYHRYHTRAVAVVGGENVPRVFANLADVTITEKEQLASIGHIYDAVTDKWATTDQCAEFLYMGTSPLPFMAPAGTRQLLDYATWLTHTDHLYCVPVFDVETFIAATSKHTVMNVIRCTTEHIDKGLIHAIENDATVILLLSSDASSYFRDMRQAFDVLAAHGVQCPVILERKLQAPSLDVASLHASTDVGGLLIEGYGDAVMLDVSVVGARHHGDSVRLAYGILQAARTRMTKTEYISCPSCGRTLFDLQETTSMIRAQTDHLKGIKIGIMGCIVNGPGEMADADYGYVGSGPDRITLYRGQEIVQRNIPSAGAVDVLIDIIRTDGRWVER